MNIKSFEDYFDKKILTRGRDYYKSGAVISLERTAENTYSAEVEGSEIYDVEICLDGSGEIFSVECDCPYFDTGEYCKHIAAVLYMLKENKVGKKPAANKKTLPELLESCTKKQLIEIIIERTNEDKSFRNYLKMALSDDSDTKSLVSDFKKAANNFFSGYSDTYFLYKAAEIVFSKTEKLSEPIEKISIYADILSFCEDNTDSFYEVADDEDYTIFEIISECSDKLEEAVIDTLADCCPETTEAIWNILISKWNGFNDYDGEDRLFPVPLHFGMFPEYRKKLDKILVSRITSAREYEKEYVVRQRFDIINIFGTKEEKREFIESHTDEPFFRELAIKQYLSEKKYEKAEQLAIDGEHSDNEAGRYATKWQKLRYDIYKASGETKKLRDICRVLIIGGDSALYDEWKTLIPAEKRDKEIQKMLDDKNNYSYEHIILAEKMYDRIFAYCCKNPYKIPEHYKRLKGSDFEEKGRQLFEKYVRYRADGASSRPSYRDVCKLLNDFSKQCGVEAAKNIAADLRRLYCRKPAFMDELGKSGF